MSNCMVCHNLKSFLSLFSKKKGYKIIENNQEILFERNKNYILYGMIGDGRKTRINQLLKSDKITPTILISLKEDFSNVLYEKHLLDFVDIKNIESSIKLGNSIHLTFDCFGANKEKIVNNLIEIYKILNTLEAQHYRLIINEFNYFSEPFFKQLADENLPIRKNIILTMSYVQNFKDFNSFIDEIYIGRSCDERLISSILNEVNYINKHNVNTFYKIDYKYFLKDCIKE